MSIWITLFLILIVIEILTTGLVTIWFAIGSLFAFIVSIFTDNVLLQSVVFVVISIISLLLTRPIVCKYLKPKQIKTNFDKVIGQTGIVTKKITELERGEVKVDGKYWTAISKEKIDEGSKVEILSIEGVKLVVKLKEEDD